MRLALELFGQYRSYALHLHANLCSLFGALNTAEDTVDVFIYTEGNRDMEAKIKSIVESFPCTVKSVLYYKDIPEINKEESREAQKKFNDYVKQTLGEAAIEYGHHGYNGFVKEYMYRKYWFHQNVPEGYDYYISARLFDVQFRVLKPFRDYLKPKLLLACVDTIFIADYETLSEYLKDCVTLIPKREVMTTPSMLQAITSYDTILRGCMPYLCSELMCLKALEDKETILIRYNFSRGGVPRNTELFHVTLCGLRHQIVSNNSNKLIKLESPIKRAVYGDTLDVTKKVGLDCEFQISNSFFKEDPKPGAVKTLKVTLENDYTIELRENTFVIFTLN